MPLIYEALDIFKTIKFRDSRIQDMAMLDTDSLATKSGGSLTIHGKNGKVSRDQETGSIKSELIKERKHEDKAAVEMLPVSGQPVSGQPVSGHPVSGTQSATTSTVIPEESAKETIPEEGEGGEDETSLPAAGVDPDESTSNTDPRAPIFE